MSASGLATILHVDLDAFFVSMELLRRPDLRGRPVIVAGGLGPRAVVNTCSYEARAFGVRSAMPLSRARTLCPTATVLPTDFSMYAPASRQFHAILREFTPLVEAAGADEAYLDVEGTERLWGPPPAVGAAIRQRVRSEIGITASVGIAVNKLVAKVASDAAKPDGLLVVPAGGEAAFFAPRPVRELPMVGPRTAERLARLGISTIGDIAATPRATLVGLLGEHGGELHERAQGRYSGGVSAGRATHRSVSREHTFATDVTDEAQLRACVMDQARRVSRDLERQGLSARTVTLKLRFPPFQTVTRSTSFDRPLSLSDEITTAALGLLATAWAGHGRLPVRLIGTGATNLGERASQLALGEGPTRAELDRTLSELERRFGSQAVRRGAEIPSPRSER